MSFKEKQLGDFALEKKLGQGGMGEVYKARQVSLDRVVAVKILPKSLAAQENFIERFQREAKAAANLIHPNVIQIYSIGVEAGTPYFAMEYVEGEDLQQRMKRLGKLTYEESVEIISGVGNALACAFEKGIVHRDIKPSNIMIDKNGVIKVMDFGLAKATQDGGAVNLTQSGLIMGTPNYISPEQGKGETIDSRSDIYSLGVVFYEMLTGLLPFRAETPAALIYKHAFETPDPPTKLTADIPPFLEEICLRMLAKDPRERYPNPKALLADLNEFRRNPDYYMRGGKRRTPAITGSGVHEASTLVGGASMGGGQAPIGGGLGSGLYPGSTSGFKRADTVPDSSQAGVPGSGAATLIEAGQRRSGASTKVALGIVVVAALGAGGYLLFGRGPSRGGKVVFPLSKLEGRVPKSVQGFIQVGFQEKSYLTFRDQPVDPKEYTLIFTRTGYKPLTRTINVTADGIDPPLESIEFHFEPTEDADRQFKKAKQNFDNKQYKEALALLEGLVQNEYPGAAELEAGIEKILTTTQATLKRGVQLARERRWLQAIETLRQLPEGSEERSNAENTVQSAELALAAIKTQTDNFERQLADGHFDAADGTLTQLRHLLPDGDPAVAAYDGRIHEAQDNFTRGQAEFKNRQWDKAVEYFEKLLKACPRHEEGSRLLAEARTHQTALLTKDQQLTDALAASKKAFDEGNYIRAAEEAKRALFVDKESNVATDLLARSLAKVSEQEIAEAFKILDGYFRERKIFQVLERVDSTDPKIYQALQADLQTFFAAPVDVKSAQHTDYKVAKDADDRATVETTWNIVLAFPEVKGSATAAHQEVSVSLKQRVKMRKGGSGWIFVSFEQMGEKNVQ